MTCVTVASLISFIEEELEVDVKTADADTGLIGSQALVDSMGLVQICLHLEEAAEGAGFEFDWASEKAMSTNNSMFRTIGNLVDEYHKQKNEAMT